MAVKQVAAAPNVGRLLVRSARAFEAELNERLRRLGYADVRVAHSSVFGHIDVGGTRIIDLAERANMTKQSMAELVEDLIAKGYLERRPDPTDGRARLITLTARGRTHVRAAQREIELIEARYEAILGKQGLEGLREALSRIGGQAE